MFKPTGFSILQTRLVNPNGFCIQKERKFAPPIRDLKLEVTKSLTITYFLWLN
jgi:hypothetical protein